MKHSISVLLFACIAFGCVGCGIYQWEKPGSHEGDFHRDAAACDQGPNAPANSFATCMRGHGWVLK